MGIGDYMVNRIVYYIEYKRIKKGFLDVLANILALITSLYGAFGKSFSFFYSSNFDNYKIIEKILSDEKENILSKNTKNINNKKIQDKQLTNDINNSDLLINKPSIQHKLIPNDDDEHEADNDNDNDNLNDNNVDINNDNVNIDKLITNFPKFRFWHILFNSKCFKSNKNKFISKCDDMIYKYISIDYILSNQMKLENLLKDYKWNDPQKNNIGSNEMIIDLKKIFDKFD